MERFHSLVFLFPLLVVVSSSCPFMNSTSACKDWQREVRLSQLEAKTDSLVQELAVLKKSDVERKAELRGMRGTKI